jgi:hypothetical protein
MKQFLLLALLSVFSVFATANAMTTTYNFAVDAADEAGHSSYVDNDLTVTASNGAGVVASGVAPNVGDRYWAYLDGPSGNTNTGGLGVCRQPNGNCASMSDDNQMVDEYIHMRWDNVVNILNLNIQGDHVETIAGTNLRYSLDLGVSWADLPIAGLALADVPVNWISDSLDYHITGLTGTSPEMYLASMKVSAVPVPAAVWLFGTALIGFVGLGRRTNVA